MGSLCSCCSRNKATTKSTNTSTIEDERQAMLDNTSNPISTSPNPKIAQLKTNTHLTPLAKYGSTSETSYTPLKDKSGTTKKLNASHATVDESKMNRIIEHDSDSIDDTTNTNTNKTIIKNFSDMKDKENENPNDSQISEQKSEHNISISQTNLIICNAGYNEIHGDYRWFPHSNKWCLFKENISYSLDKDIDVNEVYSQLKKLQSVEADFRWDENIEKCWILSNLDQSAIYYAAPQLDKYNKYIPNDKNIWISVHGSLPSPDIYANLLEQSAPPDKDDMFGNIQKSLTSNSLPAIDETNDQKDIDNDNDIDNNNNLDDDDDDSMSDLD